MNYVELKKLDRIGRITLQDQATKNALSLGRSQAIWQAMTELANDDDISVIVLQGEGSLFSSGGNLREMKQCLLEQSNAIEANAATLADITKLMWHMEKPIIASVNQGAYGAGASLVLGCDLRIASHDAKLGFSFIKVGLMPDGGGMNVMCRILGVSLATEFSMLGSSVAVTDERIRHLFHAVVVPEELEIRTLDLAQQLAKQPKAALAAIKRARAYALANQLDAYLEEEVRLQNQLSQTDHFREGVDAFLAKRAPEFSR